MGGGQGGPRPRRGHEPARAGGAGGPALIIVNPASGAGRTGKEWPSVAAQLAAAGLEFEVAMTSRPMEAIELARRAVMASRPLVVAAGGDGTINEVANGFFDGAAAIETKSRLGIVPLGSGGDFRKTFGIPRDIGAAAGILIDGYERTIDCGRVSFASDDGRGVRYFINIADAGVGGLVAHRVNRSSKVLGADLTYMLYALVTVLGWKNRQMTVVIDGDHHDLKAQQVVVANCKYFGSGMKMAPDAIPDDGLFDVVLVGDVGVVENLTGLSKIKAGTHIENNPKITVIRGRRVEVSCPQEVRIDVDGEQPGMLPAVFEMIPAALKVIAPR